MHTIANKKKLIARVRRVRGQVEAVERALEDERGCEEVMRTIAAARGAINSLAAKILCEQLEAHVAAPELKSKERKAGAEELAAVMARFLV
ncbi:MAG TPA: metal/formaldehyde-sensitive transcriptional repressor [Polyangiaceae bacterium]|nr:metal/formaldehyde-sensitive transcriptional repressor [Polyangiaceae bacterium]